MSLDRETYLSSNRSLLARPVMVATWASVAEQSVGSNSGNTAEPDTFNSYTDVEYIFRYYEAILIVYSASKIPCISTKVSIVTRIQ